MRVWLRDKHGSGALSASAGPGEGYLILGAEDDDEARTLKAIEVATSLAQPLKGYTGFRYAITVPVHDLLQLALP